MEPLILTARLQEDIQPYFDQLRQKHFPPERNFLRAHLTLFHSLPQANRDMISSQLHDTTRRESSMEGWTSRVRSLGKGVAFDVDCPRLASLRASLAQLWHHDLTAQDRHTPRLHVTVQNKVTPEEARTLLDALHRDFKPRQLIFEGLDLWKYLGGPWSLVEAFAFMEETNGAQSNGSSVRL